MLFMYSLYCTAITSQKVSTKPYRNRSQQLLLKSILMCKCKVGLLWMVNNLEYNPIKVPKKFGPLCASNFKIKGQNFNLVRVMHNLLVNRRKGRQCSVEGRGSKRERKKERKRQIDRQIDRQRERERERLFVRV